LLHLSGLFVIEIFLFFFLLAVFMLIMKQRRNNAEVRLCPDKPELFMRSLNTDVLNIYLTEKMKSLQCRAKIKRGAAFPTS
jgi:hypothetical protein